MAGGFKGQYNVGGSRYLDSVEMFTYELNVWKIIESLKLPSSLVSLNMIRVQNTVFLTGIEDKLYKHV